jgi:hypothetical protein
MASIFSRAAQAHRKPTMSAQPPPRSGPGSYDLIPSTYQPFPVSTGGHGPGVSSRASTAKHRLPDEHLSGAKWRLRPRSQPKKTSMEVIMVSDMDVVSVSKRYKDECCGRTCFDRKHINKLASPSDIHRNLRAPATNSFSLFLLVILTWTPSDHQTRVKPQQNAGKHYSRHLAA